MLLWTGMWFLSISATRPYHLIGLLSPLFTFTLITFVSGIPVAERLGDKRWRRLVAYNQYKLIYQSVGSIAPSSVCYVALEHQVLVLL